MSHLSTTIEEALERFPTNSFSQTRRDIERIYDLLRSSVDTCSLCDFHAFWSDLTLRLATAHNLPLKLFGWEQVSHLIESAAKSRPPPRVYVVSGAGVGFVNGKYELAASKITSEEFVHNVIYEQTVG